LVGWGQQRTEAVEKISSAPKQQQRTEAAQQRTEASSSAPKLPAPVGVEVAWNGCQPAPGPQ